MRDCCRVVFRGSMFHAVMGRDFPARGWVARSQELVTDTGRYLSGSVDEERLRPKGRWYARSDVS